MTAVRRSPLIVAVLCGAAVAGLTILVKTTPYFPLDDSVLRAIQSLDLGPLTAPFPFFRWAGGPGGTYMAAATIALVLLFNRRAWLLAVAAIAGGVWYEVLIVVAHRARPTADQVLRITEQPGSTSFPSGHVIFITIDLAVLMLCIGHRYLTTWANRIGWTVVGVLVDLPDEQAARRRIASATTRARRVIARCPWRSGTRERARPWDSD